MLKGFKEFIFKGNVIDLAVAVVVGGAFTGIINALVKDLITPLIGAFGGTPNFSGIFFTINNSKFMVGDFLNALISFLIVAAVIYFLVVTPMNQLMAVMKKNETTPINEKICQDCLSSIPLKAKRCKFCTSIQKK